MSLEEKFMQGIQSAWREERLKRLAPMAVAEWWEIVRDEVIVPTLAAAVKALTTAGLYGEQIKKNGGTGVMLEAAASHGDPTRLHLTFTFTGRDIRVQSSEEDLKTSWDDRDFVTEESVAAVVDAFLRSVARKCPKQKLTFGIR